MIHNVSTLADAAKVPVATVRYHCARGVMSGLVEHTQSQWVIPDEVAARFIRAAHAARLWDRRVVLAWSLCCKSAFDRLPGEGLDFNPCTLPHGHRGGCCPGGVECQHNLTSVFEHTCGRN